MTGEGVGQVLSSETNMYSRTPTLSELTEGNTGHTANCKAWPGPAESKTLSTHRSLLHGSRESPQPTAADGAAVRAGNPKGAIPR